MSEEKTIIDKTLDEQTEKVGTIKAAFVMQSKAIVYDVKERAWFFAVMIAFELPRTYRGYSVSLVFNESPYLDRIGHCKKRIEHVKSQDNLLTPTKQEQDHIAREVKKIMEEMGQEERAMKELAKRCVPMEFGAKLTELKYSGGESKVKFQIPDTIIGTLNDVKHLLDYYRMVLVPLT